MDVRGEAAGPVQPVAIVGVALRFPGSLDPFSFHDLTISGRRLFRLDYSPDPGPRGPGPAEAVAPGRGSPAAAGVTPWHALAVETGACALADASIDALWARCGAGAIVAGIPGLGRVPGAAAASPMPAIGAWVPERLGLIDARRPCPDALSPINGCSLRAVAAACEALSSGEFDLMLAGGVSTGSGGGVRPQDIRVYDANPTGPLPGEGCGMVVLVRAADARSAGLPVYAEIAGWSSPADDPRGGRDLRSVITTAYLRAGVDPADLQLVEGHGAATATEDVAELTALAEVLGPRPPRRPGSGCALGAVSANIGDTQGAAGVAALLKASLAMTAATIPPTTGCVEPHELLRQRSTPFRLPRSPEEWPEGAPKLAAVNSLGVAGPAGTARSGATHLVLRREQDPHRPGRRRRARGPHGPAPDGTQAQGIAALHRAGRMRHAAPSAAGLRGTHVVPPRPWLPQDILMP